MPTPSSGEKRSSKHDRAIAEIRYFGKLILKALLGFFVPIIALLTLIHFPYDTDSTSAAESRRSKSYYEAAYQSNDGRRGLDYEEVARQAALNADIDGHIRSFVRQYGLQDKHILEVGSGRGYLQDVVPDYTGLDLSASVASKYHKPFVAASATAMPFPDSSFDAIWTVWVLEHIPEPEKALQEMRRVLKPGGLLYLAPAWNCSPWAADGFDVRPYRDFTWRGKLVKASLPIRKSPYFVMAYLLPVRGIRWLEYKEGGQNTRLHFRRLEPNYEVYWQDDSDAAVSIDAYEAELWFRAHGDECLNCSGEPQYLILRIHKN
jgi:SAM-dependent methyltransferase